MKVEKAFPNSCTGIYAKESIFTAAAKGCHNGRTETVDQSLYHQDTEIHDRLLHTGQCGERDYLLQTATVKAHILPAQLQFRPFLACVEHYPPQQPLLCYDGGRGSPSIPQPSCRIKNRSRMTFSTTETARNQRGVTESPTARNSAA